MAGVLEVFGSDFIRGFPFEDIAEKFANPLLILLTGRRVPTVETVELRKHHVKPQKYTSQSSHFTSTLQTLPFPRSKTEWSSILISCGHCQHASGSGSKTSFTLNGSNTQLLPSLTKPRIDEK